MFFPFLMPWDDASVDIQSCLCFGRFMNKVINRDFSRCHARITLAIRRILRTRCVTFQRRTSRERGGPERCAAAEVCEEVRALKNRTNSPTVPPRQPEYPCKRQKWGTPLGSFPSLCERARRSSEQIKKKKKKSSLMRIQSSGTLEGDAIFGPSSLHVPNTDCVFSSIPRQSWEA